MRIAVNTRHLMTDRLEGVGIVTDEVMKRMVNNHPEHHFDYYFDRPFDKRFVHGANVSPWALAPVTRLPLLIRYWLNHPVRRSMVRLSADVFFSPDGFIPFHFSAPSVSMFHDVAYLRYPEMLQNRIRKFYDKWIPRYLAETSHIITVSHFSKSELISGYGVAPEKISVVHNGLTEIYKPLSSAEKTSARATYADGAPYFVYLGAIHPRKNVITLIRAFDQYKTKNGSAIKLILAGRPSWHTNDVFEAAQKSAFKNDIVFPGYVATDEATTLVGGAEAMIYPSLYEGFGLPLVEAMACDVPVICSNAASLPEVAGDAALLFDPLDSGQLSMHLEAMASDETLREDLISKGRIRRKEFSWDKASEHIYNILLEVVKRGV